MKSKLRKGWRGGGDPGILPTISVSIGNTDAFLARFSRGIKRYLVIASAAFSGAFFDAIARSHLKLSSRADAKAA